MAAEISKEKEEGLNLEDYWVLFLSNWYWFVITVIVALIVGVLYIKRTTPMYTESTQLLIKDDEKGSSSNSLQDFKDLGIIKSATNINNEMLTISAPVMMEETARRLHLDLQLSVDQSLHKVPLYNDAPISLTFPSKLPEDYTFSFQIELVDGAKAKLSHFAVKDGEVSGETITAALGTEVNTPAGKLRIDRTPSWNNSFVGRTIYVDKMPLKSVGALYSSRLGVALSDKESTVLNLTLSDEVPDRAKDVLLTLIDVYNEKWVKDKNRMAESTSKFISERLAAITAELGDVDSRISDYKSSNLLPDIQASLAKDMAQSSKNYDNLLQLTNQLSMARYLRDHLASNKNKNELMPSNTGIGENGVENLISEYNKLMLNRISYVENSSENSPTVRDIDLQLASQRTAILRTLDNAIAQIGQQIAGLQRSDQDINSQIASNPRQAKVLESVTRQQKVKEALYIFLLQKREENELSRTYTAWNTSIIQPPTGSSSPTSPKSSIILLASFVIGLVIPGALLFLRETMSHSVRGRADLEGMKTPLLGEIPALYQKKHWWQRNQNAPRKVMIEDGAKDLINESFRIVRTKLMYFVGNNADGKCKTIMLTSFNPGSGKSFITANLAATLALNSKRILAIDLDLRHGSLSHMSNRCGPGAKAGVSAFLGGITDDIDSLIVKSGISEGVDLLPAGIIPPNPTELLMSPRMAQLIEKMRQQYDYIFFDCPPIEIVADASIIQDFADISLFVVRAGLLDRRVLPEIDELYKENCYNKLSILLNGTPYVSGKYGNYKYGYGYAYGYQYGYAHDYDKN